MMNNFEDYEKCIRHVLHIRQILSEDSTVDIDGTVIFAKNIYLKKDDEISLHNGKTYNVICSGNYHTAAIRETGAH
jgi:hypothetical protein